MAEPAAKKKVPVKRASKSSVPETIWGAVLAARNMAEPIVKDSRCSMGGGGYNYLSTETVLRECIPIMSACGLVLMPQRQTFDPGQALNEPDDGTRGASVMNMHFALHHVPSGEMIEFTHSLPIENLRQSTKGSLAVRTTAFQYVIRDILALPRVEERQPEVDNPDGGKQNRKKSSAKKPAKSVAATDEQIQYLRDRQAEHPDPEAYGETMNERLTSKYGVTMDTITSDVASIVIKQFETKRKDVPDAMANG